jgi:hypothetical protein
LQASGNRFGFGGLVDASSGAQLPANHGRHTEASTLGLDAQRVQLAERQRTVESDSTGR